MRTVSRGKTRARNRPAEAIIATGCVSGSPVYVLIAENNLEIAATLVNQFELERIELRIMIAGNRSGSYANHI